MDMFMILRLLSTMVAGWTVFGFARAEIGVNRDWHRTDSYTEDARSLRWTTGIRQNRILSIQWTLST